MAAIRAALHGAWEEHGADALPRDERIELALRLFAEPFCEDKLAGVLALAERLLPELTVADIDALARPFADGHVDDWNTRDWYCVKPLGRSPSSTSRRGERASTRLHPAPARRLRGERPRPRPLRQTSVGWLLRELSKAEPEAVAAFLDEHDGDMSAEARRAARRRAG